MSARRSAIAVLAVSVALISAAPAGATYDPIAGGQTKLTFSSAFIGLIKSHGVKLTAKAPVTLKGATAGFPVSGGKVDPVAVRGSIEHEGALVFKAAGHSLPLKGLTLKTTQAHSPLTAKFGGGQLKLAERAKLTTERSGFGLRAKVTQIKLSAKVATRLDKKLGLRGVFKAGQLLASSITTAQPATVAIRAGGSGALQLTPAFAAKLSSLFVAVNPVFPAEHLGAPFTLPIGGGQIAPDAGTGDLKTNGSLELIQQGGGQVFLREFIPDFGAATTSAEVDAEPSPPLPGKLGLLPAFGLLPGTVAAEPTARTITVSGATLTLSAAIAALLNEAFATPQHKAGVFAAGEALGTLSFTAQAE